jgi:mRNA interferase MazF
MADRINRGEIWLYVFRPPDKRRPVLVLSRSEVIDLLHTVIVAPVSSTVHGVPSEVMVGIDEGLKRDSAINLDHIQTVDKAKLKHFVGTVGPQKMKAVCSALAIATGCDTQSPAN